MAISTLKDDKGISDAEITHFVFADGTGESAAQMLKAARYQFNERANIELLPEIRTVADLKAAFEQVRACPTRVGILATSFVVKARDEFEGAVKNFAEELQVPYISFMSGLLSASEELYGSKPKGIPGFMSAVKFAQDNDDGQGEVDILQHARIAFFGVSRVGKTSLCHHMAALYGIRVTNCPFTPPQGILPKFFDLPDTLKIVLKKDPERLADVRQERARQGSFGRKVDEAYIDIDRIDMEQTELTMLAKKHRWPIIDVTRKLHEETAKAAILHLNRFRQQKGLQPYVF